MACHTSLPNPYGETMPVVDPHDPQRGTRATSRPHGTPDMIVTNDMLDEAKFFRDIGQPGRERPDFLKVIR